MLLLKHNPDYLGAYALEHLHFIMLLLKQLYKVEKYNDLLHLHFIMLLLKLIESKSYRDGGM